MGRVLVTDNHRGLERRVKSKQYKKANNSFDQSIV